MSLIVCHILRAKLIHRRDDVQIEWFAGVFPYIWSRKLENLRKKDQDYLKEYPMDMSYGNENNGRIYEKEE